MKRIPTLDGWRGVAILLVLADHLQFAFLHRFPFRWSQTGQHGVTIFFVLSGFLITTRLIEGPANLSRFYLRRFFRLMPAAWAYLIFLLILDRAGNLHFTSLTDVASCVFFYRNYISHSGGIGTGHFWSLSLEEQFYLFWPLLLVLAGKRRCLFLAPLGALAVSAFRLAHWEHYNQVVIDFRTEVRADELLVGCTLALLMANPSLLETIKRYSRFLALPALGALLFAIDRQPWLPPLYESLAIATLIAASVLHPHSQPSRILAWQPLAWLGTVSYSLYLWHPFFLDFNADVRVYAMCVMPLFALGSYYLIERPMIQLGHRLTRAR